MEQLKILTLLAFACITTSLAGTVPDAKTGCGIQKNSHGEMPWTVSIHDRKYATMKFISGALIHPKVVLVNADYFVERDQADFIVYAGEWKSGQPIFESFPDQGRKVNSLVNHESAEGYDFNVALLFLNDSYVLGDNVNTICLPDSDKSFENKEDCIASAWKLARESFSLQKNMVTTITEEECSRKKSAGIFSKDGNISKATICGTYPVKNDKCREYIGSPLACPTVEGVYELAGVHSWTMFDPHCDTNGSLSGFVELSKIRGWIDDEMKKAGL